jgi:hypothetical protein
MGAVEASEPDDRGGEVGAEGGSPPDATVDLADAPPPDGQSGDGPATTDLDSSFGVVDGPADDTTGDSASMPDAPPPDGQSGDGPATTDLDSSFGVVDGPADDATGDSPSMPGLDSSVAVFDAADADGPSDDGAATAPISDNQYRIRSVAAAGANCVELIAPLADGSLSSGAVPIESLGCDDSPDQIWNVTNVAGDLYWIRTTNAVGDYLDLVDAGASGEGTVEADDGTAGPPLWLADALGGGRYTFHPQHSVGTCLGVDSTSNASPLSSALCAGLPEQSFTLAVDTQPVFLYGTYRVALGVAAETCVSEGTTVAQTAPCEASATWSFNQESTLGFAVYQIQSKIDGRCLDWSLAEGEAGSSPWPIALSACDDAAPAQMWSISKATSSDLGEYLFEVPYTLSGSTTLCMTAEGGTGGNLGVIVCDAGGVYIPLSVSIVAP